MSTFKFRIKGIEGQKPPFFAIAEAEFTKYVYPVPVRDPRGLMKDQVDAAILQLKMKLIAEISAAEIEYE